MAIVRFKVIVPRQRVIFQRQYLARTAERLVLIAYVWSHVYHCHNISRDVCNVKYCVLSKFILNITNKGEEKYRAEIRILKYKSEIAYLHT